MSTRTTGAERAERVQRVSSRRCADCGARVVRRRGARGPLPALCGACAARRQPVVQLRAYLRSSQRLAWRLGLTGVAQLAAEAIDDLDASAGGSPATRR